MDDKQSKPLVTVLIAAYNRPDFVNQAIESVCGQTFRDYELVVVDDCSDSQVVEQYRLPEGARLIRLDHNHGVASAGRNVGIREAKGEFVAFLDMDDLWLPGKLETQVTALQENPSAGLTHCRMQIVDESLTPLERENAKYRPPNPNRDQLRQLLRWNYVGNPSCVLARRGVLLECGLFDDTLPSGNDWDMWLRVAAKHPMHCDSAPMMLYRKHAGQMTRNDMPMRKAHVRILGKAQEWAECHRPDLVGLIRRLRCRALRKLAKLSLRENADPAEALKLLKEAKRAWPWSLRVYGLMVTATIQLHAVTNRSRNCR